MTELRFKSTMDVRVIQSMGSDAHLAAAAWVATSSEEGLARAASKPDDVEGVIRYLIKHRHGSPFEHSAMTFYVHAPIFVWREWHRHRIGFAYADYGMDEGMLGQSFNEESGRYKQLDPVFFLPDRERPMMKVDGWKPGRPKFTRCECDNKFNRMCSNLMRAYKLSYEMYEDNLNMGFDPGLARDCINVGIYSSCWVTCNPRSLMSFLSLRTHEPERARDVSYPLWEIEMAARLCEEVLGEGWPITYKAFCENGRVGP